MTVMIFDSGAGRLVVASNAHGTADITLNMAGVQLTAPWSGFRDLIVPALRAHGMTVSQDHSL
jgi:hypothetical protein